MGYAHPYDQPPRMATFPRDQCPYGFDSRRAGQQSSAGLGLGWYRERRHSESGDKYGPPGKRILHSRARYPKWMALRGASSAAQLAAADVVALVGEDPVTSTAADDVIPPPAACADSIVPRAGDKPIAPAAAV